MHNLLTRKYEVIIMKQLYIKQFAISYILFVDVKNNTNNNPIHIPQIPEITHPANK